jgi:hypothetical protein
LKEVIVGLHVAWVWDFIVGTDWRTLIVIEYSVLSLHFAGVVGVRRSSLLGVELLVDTRIVILHVVTPHWNRIGNFLFARLLLSNLNHLLWLLQLLILELNL